MGLQFGAMLDVIELLREISADVQSVRAVRQLPALVCPGTSPVAPFLMGQEQAFREHAPPRVVFIPTAVTANPGPLVGLQQSANWSQMLSKTFYWGLVEFEVHLWGDPDPTGANPLADFNSAVELYREVVGASIRQSGGIPCVKTGRAEWKQPANDNRLGRLLVLQLGIYVPISDEPYSYVPIANPGVPGTSVQIDVTVAATFPDGTSSVAGTIDLP